MFDFAIEAGWDKEYGGLLYFLDCKGLPTEAYEHALSIDPLHRKAANNLGFALEKRMASGEADLREAAVNAWIQDTIRAAKPNGVAGKTPRDIRIHFRTSTEVVVTVVTGTV